MAGVRLRDCRSLLHSASFLRRALPAARTGRQSSAESLEPSGHPLSAKRWPGSALPGHTNVAHRRAVDPTTLVTPRPNPPSLKTNRTACDPDHTGCLSWLVLAPDRDGGGFYKSFAKMPTCHRRKGMSSRGNKPAQRIVVRIVVHFVSPRVGVMWKCLAASAMARARPAPPPCRDADLGARKQTKIGRKLRLVRLNFTRVLAGRGLDSQRARPVVPPQSRYAARRRRMSAIGGKADQMCSR